MKKIFGRLSTADLIKQVSVVSLLIAIGVVLQRPLDFHIGFFHIISSTIIFSFLILIIADLRISIIGVMTMITVGEFLIGFHDTFWTNYVPIFIAAIIINISKIFNKIWLTIIFYLIAMIEFQLLKTLIVYLTYGSARGYSQLIGALCEIALDSVVVIPVYLALYKVMKIINFSVYSYNE